MIEQLDWVNTPAEVWADWLEDCGEETDGLREWIVKGLSTNDGYGSSHDSTYGSGYGYSYSYGYGYGFGSGYGHGYGYVYGSGYGSNYGSGSD